jgi:hypothetical protein
MYFPSKFPDFREFEPEKRSPQTTCTTIPSNALVRSTPDDARRATTLARSIVVLRAGQAGHAENLQERPHGRATTDSAAPVFGAGSKRVINRSEP